MYRHIKEIIKEKGTDLRNENFDNIYFCEYDLSNIILPQDTNLFQKIKNKSLRKTKLPKGDYSKYDFSGVNIRYTKFTKDSILPKDKDLFQKIQNKTLYGTTLPNQEFDHTDKTNVDFRLLSIRNPKFFSKEELDILNLEKLLTCHGMIINKCLVKNICTKEEFIKTLCYCDLDDESTLRKLKPFISELNIETQFLIFKRNPKTKNYLIFKNKKSKSCQE